MTDNKELVLALLARDELIEALVKERGEAAMRYNDAVDDLNAAEAQVAKLREALTKIADSAPIEFVEIAERALEGK